MRLDLAAAAAAAVEVTAAAAGFKRGLPLMLALGQGSRVRGPWALMLRVAHQEVTMGMQRRCRRLLKAMRGGCCRKVWPWTISWRQRKHCWESDQKVRKPRGRRQLVQLLQLQQLLLLLLCVTAAGAWALQCPPPLLPRPCWPLLSPSNPLCVHLRCSSARTTCNALRPIPSTSSVQELVLLLVLLPMLQKSQGRGRRFRTKGSTLCVRPAAGRCPAAASCPRAACSSCARRRA
mmetsp:Transcript_12735/g.33803  ORF Transcript_12735/g.33803 Transcript_12735/m.33803 type:complete len:234 (-) Transcript_12735:1765-2466(-)